MSLPNKIWHELQTAFTDKNNLILTSANLIMLGVLVTLLITPAHSSTLFAHKPQVLAAQIEPTEIPPSPTIQLTLSPTLSPTPSLKPIATHTPTPTPTKVLTTPQPTATPAPQITAQPTNSMAHQILDALNAYRQKKGVAPLAWDDTLGNFAQSRADLYVSQGGMDNHTGFKDMLNNDGFAKLGFNALGENASWGDFQNPTYLIETMYAGDAPHDQNQLNPDWTHVGIGVNGQATDLVFGGKKR